MELLDLVEGEGDSEWVLSWTTSKEHRIASSDKGTTIDNSIHKCSK